MTFRITYAITILLMFGAICVLENSTVKAKPPEPAERGVSSVYMLAGEFRTVFANLLWIKAEQYHHEFLQHNKDWAKNKELVGLLNLITNLDPHFPEAYAVGTSIYADGFNDKNRALRYLIEGIHNNPRSWELHRIATIMYARHLHDPQRALFHARLTVKYCDDQWYAPSLHRLLQTVQRLADKPE
ncbi:MAG: hypothetical protein M1133_00325 [Armatimonadetes bacterium]|nr:hypothetical protein [Armatimonadota bacterium]